ncbi:MAG: outer membrane protein assembly factor [Vicinamibacterales bacterium]
MVRRAILLAVCLFVPALAMGQQPAATAAAGPQTICGQPIPAPRALPPANSGPVVYLIAPCFESQGNVSLIDYQTYLYYIQLKTSRPSEGVWVPYDETAERTILEDFRRLWGTNFLDNISIEVQDYPFSNGVVGKLVTYNLEERQRVKIVDYVGSKKVELSKIDEALKNANAQIRLDTFIEPGLIRKVEGIVRDLMKEKGFQYANVTHDIKEMPGGPKLVHLTFNMDEGPKVKIRRVEFIGNEAMSDRTLRRQMKQNRPKHFLSFITGRGTYQENKFEEDAERITEHYRDNGYVRANVGQPELQFLEDSGDKSTRWVELRIPVTEGKRYRVGDFTFAGNTVVKSDVLRPLFKIGTGDYYSQKRIRQGFQKAQEVYGTGGYFEFSGYPDMKFRDEPGPAEQATPPALAAEPVGEAPAVADVTMQIQEGKQYFVNRITFIGNTTTRDNVIRREMRLYENGVFNTQALQYSIRRLNQLGYFKALEGPGKDVTFEKTPNVEGKVDVRLKLEEQNRNQLTFGAGVSQFEGFFGQLSFQTANFLGRGESLTVSLQGGSRAQNYTLGFTEPFLFDRNITGGINLFRSEVRYIGQFTQRSLGGVLTVGFPLGNGFTRMFTNYSYERVQVTEVSELYNNPEVLRRNPYLASAILSGRGGERIISKVVPSIVHNTVDQPIFPTTGRRLSATVDLAGLGGNTKFFKPNLEGVVFWRQAPRLIFGARAQVEYVAGNRDRIPIFERLFLGGEYSLRGFDIRTVGPQETSGIVIGGNKSLLFNIEEAIPIAGPVRLILFYDAGQVRDFGEPFAFTETVEETIASDPPLLSGIFTGTSLTDPNAPALPTRVVRRNAFKTSTGAEIRFFMPVLNVPFRLIFAYNPQREGVRDNQFRPQRKLLFRFAVGTTF